MPEFEHDSLPNTFDNSWGEKRDLRAPRCVEVKYMGNPENLPFKVKLDQEKLQQFIKDEGIVGGRDITYLLDYGGHEMHRRLKGLDLAFEKMGYKMSRLIGQILYTGGYLFGAGGFSGYNAGVYLNLENIYDKCRIKSVLKPDNLQNNFTEEVAYCLGHETQHCRQSHRDLLGARAKDVQAQRWTTLLVIDGLRRLVLPPMETGADIRTIMFVEDPIAAIISSVKYKLHPAEAEARQLGKLNKETWKKILHVEKREKR